MGGATGERRAPTIADVARLAGVSTGAVSYAMNDRPGVSASTRERIRQAAAQLGWEPSGPARALMRQSSQAVGLVVAATHLLTGNDFFASFVTGLEQALSRRDFALLLRAVGAEPQAELLAYRRMWQQHQVDGVIVGDVRADDPRLAFLAGVGMPAVVVDRLADGPSGFRTLDSDHPAGVRRAVRHLVGLGHRRVAFVGGPPHLRHVADRFSAWRAALAGAGEEPGPVAYEEATERGGIRATRAVLAARPRPTAIVYTSDLMAIAGLGAIRAAGLAVPDDVSVVGFDDVRLAAYLTPPLTTVRVDYVRLGRSCADLLLAVLAGDDPPTPPPVPAELIVRGSTAAPPARR